MSVATQSQEPKLTVESRNSEFVPVSGGTETTSAEALLLTAYIVMWALVFGFVVLTARRQARLAARLGRLEAELDRREAVADAAR